MITYYKHTDGESYILNGNDYVGFFNITNGVASTNKLSSFDSFPLTSKNNIIAEIYNGKYEFDTTYNHLPIITPFYSNVFDLLDTQGMSKMVTTINSNNLTCYKGLILGNPTVFKYEETDGRFYGFKSVDDVIEESVKYNDLYRGNIDTFSSIPTWSFLDNIISGEIMVDSFENFKYICTDGENDYVLTGSFSSTEGLTLLHVKHNINESSPDYTYSIHHDSDNSKFLFVKSSYIEVYDASNYDECDKLLLVDRIPLLPSQFKFNIWNIFDASPNKNTTTWNSRYQLFNSNNPKFIKFGKNLRSIIQNNTLHLFNKYSTDIIQTISLSNYDITEILALDIRTIDDYIGILHKKDEIMYISFFDSTNIANTIKTYNIFSIKYKPDIKIKFSDIDSNVFYTQTSTEYHSRYVSTPEYPSGRLEFCDLQYPYGLIWNKTAEKYNLIPQKWDTKSKKSNNYNNLVISHLFTNNKMYMLLHNIGRIYALQQQPNDRFLNSVPLDLKKYFNELSCSQSSIGLYINSELSNLLKDTINIFTNTSSSFTIKELEVIEKQLDNLLFDTNNLYINGNETLNALVFQRITTTITDLQNKLLPK
jgi:hypothetical protein